MIDFNRMGRMISGSKQSPKGQCCVFNANICTKSKGKIWFGDLNLTTEVEDLKRLAAEQGEDIFVLRERDARFDTADKPNFDAAVARYSPAGEIVHSIA